MKRVKSVTSLLLIVLMVLTMFPTPFNTVYAEVADHVVISESYGGGGNSGAVYKNDFIELYNPTSSKVDISGWEVFYTSTTGTFSTKSDLYYKVPNDTKIEAGGYFLIQAAAGAGGTLDLPTPDAECNIAMGASGFKVKLENAGSIVDFVGAGKANDSEGSLPAPAPSNSTSVQRKDNNGKSLGVTNGWDTDNNGNDFYTGAPTPRNSQYGQEARVANPTATPPSGEVAVGTKITLSTTTTGTSIKYKLNDDEESEYTAPIVLNDDSFIKGTATIIAVASKEGMPSSDEVTFTYTKKAPLSIITANEAKTKPEGTEVRVKGIVTYSTQTRTIFMQDESGGICVDKSGEMLNSYVGKEIDVTGTISLYGGMVQVTPASLSDIKITNDAPTMPDPFVITTYDLMNTDRAHEGKLIKIENAQIKAIGGTDSKIYNHTITQGGVDTTLRTQALPGKNVGDYITITGVAGYFNNPQIQTNAKDDVVDGVAPLVETVTALPPSGSKLPVGGTVTLSTATEDAIIKYTLNDGAEQTINSNTGKVTIDKFNQEGSQAVIKAKAVKGENSSSETTFIYTQAKTQTVKASKEGKISENTMVTLSAAEKAQIKYTVTNKAGLADETVIPETTYTEPILINIENLPIKITAYAVEEGYLNSDTSTFNYALASNEPYKNYFGQLHSHTAENSDGYGKLADAYSHARDVAKLDFFAVTDHSNSYDTAPKEDKAGTYNLGDYNKNNVKWQNGQNAAATARTDDFISIYAYEMTWSGGPGHMNTFNTEGFVSRNNTELNNKTNDAGLRAYYQLLKVTPNSISQFNHPGTTFGNFKDYAYYDPVIDERITLIEVGNGEGAIGSGAYFPSYEEYTKALDKGWHLAPTNNQDNHKGLWGDSNTARTVIYTNDLSVEGLYDALRDMRVYATEDNNLDIVYTLNGEMLGSIIDTVPGLAEFSITVNDPDYLDNIETISVISTGGKEVLSKDFASNEAKFETKIEDPAAGYYYIKVVQEDGDIAVTAPVWLGSAPKIGIDSVSYDAMMPATNEELTFTTKLFNNEAKTAKVKSIKYEIKSGDTLKTYEPNVDIAGSGGMYTHTHKHTFTQPGIFTLTVTAVLSQDGKDVTYSKDLEVNVRDSEKLVYIGIDASHNNEYVSGNYKDSMTNFGVLAAKYSVRTVELKTSEELLAALKNPKYGMMIFTVPSRRSGSGDTGGRIPFASYSDEEIQVVSEFAKSGKTVIVTGWGDYYESYANLKADPNFTSDQHMAAQQNKILAAIGSKLRLADDEAKDDVKNGGQSPRLYLTDHNNFVDPFTEGVAEGQIYSQYGGSTIFAVDSDGKPAETLPSNIYPTISGHETTYSSDDDKDGNETPPKYNNKVLLMANETITHEDGTKSTVIAAGGAFMSNFEIQVEIDNAGTLPYSNYNILENMILSLRDISTVADVREMPLGTEVIIEGIATTDVFNGSDSNKGFFDCIYIQDSTGGINLFPVANGVKAGQKIRVLGKVGEYQGEKQLQVVKVSVLDSDINMVTPISVTPEEAMSPDYTGSLVKFRGTVSEIIKDKDGVVGQLMVSGARVYINGYITKDVSLANIKVGDTVEVTGLSSFGENMSSATDFLPRIRVRDRAEIVLISSGSSSSKKSSTKKDLSSTIELNKDILINAEDEITVTTSFGDITFDKEAVEYLANNAEGNLKITIKLVDKNVYSFNVSDEKQEFSTFGNGKLYISVPYDKAANEKAKNIIIHYLNENGELETIKYCEYNNGYVSFITNNLTDYAVGYTSFDFKDVLPNSWYEDAVNFVSSRKLFIGTDEQIFDPNGPMTRAMFVTVLARLDNADLSKYANSQFADIDINEWYGKSVSWAVEKGIVKGYNNNTFGPNDNITREQMAVMLHSYIMYKGIEIEGTSQADFADDSSISSWAKSSVQAIQSYGLIKGLGNNNFGPLNTADRASVATIFMNFIKTIVNN